MRLIDQCKKSSEKGKFRRKTGTMSNSFPLATKDKKKGMNHSEFGRGIRADTDVTSPGETISLFHYKTVGHFF